MKIHTSWGTFAFFIILPAYLILLDFLASVITNTDNGLGFIWGAVLICITCFVFGTRFLKLSTDSIWYWPEFIIGKRICIQDIQQIDVRVGITYSRSGAFPAGTLYFLGKDSKVIGNISISTFSKKDVAHFLKTVNMTHPQIRFNDKAEAYSKEDDALLKKEMGQIYKNALISALIVVVLTVVIVGIVKIILVN